MQSVPWGSDLRALAHRYAERTAVRDRTGATTYRVLFRKAAELARALRQAGVTQAEPVVTFFRNGTPAVAAHYAVMLSGAADVPINPALSEADVRVCIAIAKARRA